MKIYRTVESPYVSQRFHDNLACAKVDANGELAFPIKVLPGTYGPACPVGSTKLYPALGMKAHGGIDRPTWYKEPGYFDVLDSECGFDLYMGVDHAGGLGVDAVSKAAVRECTEGCPAGTMHYVKRRYWHCASIVLDGKEISFGEAVLMAAQKESVLLKRDLKPGELIYKADSTGASGGNHVHESTKWCDEKGDGIHTDNGYYGNFDDSEYRVNEFVLDEINRRIEDEAQMAEAYRKYQEAQRLRAEIRKQQLSLLDLMAKWLLAISETLKGRKNNP